MDDLLDAFEQAWTERRRAAFREVCAADLHWTDPSSPEPLYGPDALADRAAQLWKAFPDATVESAGERLSDGRYVAVPVLVSGVHRAALSGIPATNKMITVHAVLYCELDPPREKLWRVRAFFDAYDATVQLGVLPKRGSLGERAILAVRGFGIRRGGGEELDESR